MPVTRENALDQIADFYLPRVKDDVIRQLDPVHIPLTEEGVQVKTAVRLDIGPFEHLHGNDLAKECGQPFVDAIQTHVREVRRQAKNKRVFIREINIRLGADGMLRIVTDGAFVDDRPEYVRLMDYMANELRWGEITVQVKDGLPVMIQHERRDIKLTEG